VFIRQKKNKSGSVSVQIISKHGGRYKVEKTIGSGATGDRITVLLHQARYELEKMEQQVSLFVSDRDTQIEGYLQTLENIQIRTIGPELIFGKIYDAIGFNAIEEDLFRHLVIARLAFPLSKLKTIDYVYRYQGVSIGIDQVYRFLDKLNNTLKDQVEQITYQNTLKTLKGKISIVFYDMTTLYFEASEEDDLRKVGFSKDGKHQSPQIYLGLLVGLGGYAIGYDIFEGNIYEGDTLIPVIDTLTKKFNLPKPVIVADAGLLSRENINTLAGNGYTYIIGARPKSEPAVIKNEILSAHLKDGQTMVINKTGGNRLILSHSDKRATRDEHNRKRGLQRLEKQVRSGKLTKANINNKGYNKYLRIKGEIAIEIDYDKFNEDKQWDGLKGYITNTTLTPAIVLEQYKNLWHIENAFRMSKTDLRIRPVYHRLKRRIEAHICLSFTAYAIYKELERILKKEKSSISLKKAAELTHTMYQLQIVLPESKKQQFINLKMDEPQTELWKIIGKNY
jgi:transposase